MNRDGVRSLPSEKIFLLGFMGSGKSTLGPRLAVALGMPHFDVDTEVEKVERLSIAEIFKKKGEPFFRDQESAVLKTLAEDDRQAVISLGGGSLVRTQNRDFVRGLKIYLKADPRVLALRTRAQGPKRASLPEESLELRVQRVQQFLEERRLQYEDSDFTVRTDRLTLKESCQQILYFLKISGYFRKKLQC